MTNSELKEFIFENYFKRIGFAREGSYCLMAHQKEKIYNCLELS